MYSTIAGAKKCAKSLKRLFEDSGFVFPLHKCQSATAKAGGYADWHELEVALNSADRPLEAERFRARLLTALPQPCRPPVQAWLDDELTDETIEEGIPARYFRDAFPYLMAATALHRSRTPLLRPGSGPGQRMREDLVLGLLLNKFGGRRPYPRLDPETLAFVFEGDLATLFRDDVRHPRFEAEFHKLLEGGVLQWDGQRRLLVMPPDVDALIAHVSQHHRSKVQHWDEDGRHRGELADALRDALASLGIERAGRIADAIAQQGSDAYITDSGAVLTLLTELAEEGDIITLARAYALFSQVHPANSRYVCEQVPAKVLSGYFARHLQLDVRKTTRWVDRRPAWATELKAALAEPGVFVATVHSMAGEIREAA